MTRGKIFLIPFPFDDLSATKVRPPICLTEPIGIYRHVVLAFITSQIPADLIATDLILDPGQSYFAATGLHVACTIRLHRLVTLRTSVLQRKLGEVSPALQADVDDKLRKVFGL
jgi:mRNA interferase MazF